MNIPLEQLNNSRLVQLYQKVPYTSIYSDRLKNVPSYFNNHEVIPMSTPPFSGFVSGKKIVFDLPTHSFLKNMQLKHTITSNANETSIDMLGVNIVKNVRLLQKGKQIATMNNSYLLNRIFSTPESLFNYYNSIHQPTPALNVTTSTCYTQLFLWPVENEQQNLLLSFHRDLQIEVELNTSPFSGTISSYTCELCVQKRSYNDDFLNSYIEDVYADKEGHRNYLIYDVRSLRESCTAAATSTSIDITYPLLAHSIHCCVTNNSNFNIYNINKIEIYCGTNKIIECDQVINGLATLDSLSNDLNNICSVNNAPYSYYFGSKDRMTAGLTGVQDLSIGPFKMVVYHDAIVGDICSLNVNIEYYNILQSHNSDGLFYGSAIH